MHAAILALALSAPAQGFDWDLDRETINYSRTRDRGFDRRQFGGGGYQPAPYGNGYGGGGFNAQVYGPRGGYADVRGGGYGGGYAPPYDPFARQSFEVEARFRREPRGRFPLLRYLICGPERERRFTGQIDVRRIR